MNRGWHRAWRRFLLVGCLLLPLTALLLGCQISDLVPEPTPPLPAWTATPEPEPTETIQPGVTSLIFWQPFALDRPQGLLLAEMIRDFEAENPDILIELVSKSGYVGIHLGMLAALESLALGEESVDLPDLSATFPSMIAQYAAAGVVAPLDPYVNDLDFGLSDEDLADFFPGYLEAGRFPQQSRQMMAFPFAQNAIGMWVNENLLAQAGWDHAPTTWAEFEQACFDVVAYTGVGCYPYIESVSTFTAWLYSRGGQQLDPSGRLATFNGPAGVESLALLRRLAEAGLAWRPQEPYGDYVAFANGQAAFTFSSTGNNLLYLDAYQGALQNGVPPFGWHQALIPQADPANPATALYGASFFIIRSEPEQELAAWRFIRWFTATPQTARWAGGLETTPVRLSALGVMTDTLAAHPFIQTQVETILPYARPEPAVAAGLEVRDILYSAILTVTQGYTTPQIALDLAAREANAVLSKQP